jgi:hypothetical protein
MSQGTEDGNGEEGLQDPAVLKVEDWLIDICDLCGNDKGKN